MRLRFASTTHVLLVALAPLLVACAGKVIQGEQGGTTGVGGGSSGTGASTGGGAPGMGGCPAALDPVLVWSAPMDAEAQFIAKDATHIYFIEGSLHGAPEPIARIPVCGGPVEVLATGVINGLAVAVSATDVYWLDSGHLNGQGTLSILPKAGGTPVELVSKLGTVWPLAVDASYVYWSNEGPGPQGGMKRMPLGGGPVQSIGAAHGYVNIALDDTYAYWADPSAVGRFPKTGGVDQDLAMLVPEPMGLPWCTAVDDTNVYVSVYFGPVYSIPKNGGTPTTIAPTDSHRCLAVDENYLYVPTDVDIRRIRKDGSSTDIIQAGVPAAGAAEMLVDDSNVFWGDATGIWRWSKR
jgi:hypothetical protein